MRTTGPDGTGDAAKRTSRVEGTHAVWIADHCINDLSVHGVWDECAVYDDIFQPQGGMIIQEKNESSSEKLYDSMWNLEKFDAIVYRDIPGVAALQEYGVF